MCVCQLSTGPQRFFIGDFPDGSDLEDLKSGSDREGRREYSEDVRALRHLGSGGDSKDLQRQGKGGSLQHLGSGEIAKISEGKVKVGLFSILVPGEKCEGPLV